MWLAHGRVVEIGEKPKWASLMIEYGGFSFLLVGMWKIRRTNKLAHQL
jgi:succinate-acetate transporter protein